MKLIYEMQSRGKVQNFPSAGLFWVDKLNDFAWLPKLCWAAGTALTITCIVCSTLDNESYGREPGIAYRCAGIWSAFTADS